MCSYLRPTCVIRHFRFDYTIVFALPQNIWFFTYFFQPSYIIFFLRLTSCLHKLLQGNPCTIKGLEKILRYFYRSKCILLFIYFAFINSMVKSVSLCLNGSLWMFKKYLFGKTGLTKVYNHYWHLIYYFKLQILQTKNEVLEVLRF